MKKRLHALVDGHVQGVGYRWTAVKWARQLNIQGFVRNLPEGNVEIVAEGRETSLLALLSRLRQGPRGARVLQVRDTWSEATGDFGDFQIQS